MKTNSNFSDIFWTSTEIIHNNVYQYTNKCIIGIPVYNSILSDSEKLSLNQLCKIIGHAYEICLICPNNMDIKEYVNIAYNNDVYLSFLFCNPDYFKSTETYSYLCETVDFYNCFINYDYLMIYQLDGWIFKNFLDYYIDLGVDYIGSPWRKGAFEFTKDSIGNGGISLRRVQKFIEICDSLTFKDFDNEYSDKEDLFFNKTLKNKIKLKYPSIENASNFSLTGSWHYFLNVYNNGHLPMCVHAWYKNYKIWKNYIPLYNIDYKNNLINNSVISNNINDYFTILKLKENKKIENSISKKKNDKTIKYKPESNIVVVENKAEMNNMNNTKYIWGDYLNQYYNISSNNINNNVIEKEIIKTNNSSVNNLYSITSDIIKYICESDDMNLDISDKERIIITMTSWKKRIGNVHHIIELIMNNSMQPDIININLSEEEFPNKEKDLPDNLKKDIKTNNKIRIHWVKHNTLVWKKVIPTLYKYPNDVIITIDDDFEYPSDLIKTLYNEYIKYDKKYPISGNHVTRNNMKCHCGCASLLKSSFILNTLNILNNDIIKNGSSDIFYTFCIYKNGLEYKQTSKEYFINMKAYQANEPYSTSGKNKIEETYDMCLKSFKIINESSQIKKQDILICIFNYKHDNNARRWLNALKPYFDVCVLDSGNDKINQDFIQYPNIYYSGLFNEFKKLFEQKQYKWGGIICSDVTITDENLNKFVDRVKWLNTTSNVGIWQAAADKTSRSIHGTVTDTDIQYKIWIEGWLIFMKSDIIKRMPVIDNNVYGWNIDIVSEIISHKLNLLNIIDNQCIVHHPADRGYSEDEARKQGQLWEKNVLQKLKLKKPLSNEIKKFPIEYIHTNDVTFIMINRNGQHVKKVIKNFKDTFVEYFSDIKFIVVQQDDNEPFKRAQLINIGVKFSNTEYIGIIDNDIINLKKFNPIEIYNKFNHGYVAFNKIAQLTKNNTIITEELRTQGFGAFNFMKRDDFINVNGETNLCSGWGAEDNIFNIKYNFKRYENTLGHIQHEKRKNDTPKLYQFNNAVYKRYQNNLINLTDDGYNQIMFDISKIYLENNIFYIDIKNIRVIPEFKYLDLYNNMKSVEKQYIEKMES